MSNERKIIFEKKYDSRDHFLGMLYGRHKHRKDEVLYCSEISKMEPSEWEEYDEVFGVYCLKCGTLHEYTISEYHKLQEKHRASPHKGFSPCKCCGKKTALGHLLEANGTYSDSVIATKALSGCVPVKLSIVAEKERINISFVLRNWGFNPKAGKPYFKNFQITIVVNAKLGQTYVMPATWDGKTVFKDMDSLRTASISNNINLKFLNDIFFKKDAEASKALSNAFSKVRPEMAGNYNSLQKVARANFLGPLYNVFHETGDYIDGHQIKKWKTLNRRYKKNPETFPQYLTYGCKDVATKSIKKILYKNPEKRWTLLYLHKIVGLKNCDIIRSLLTDESREAGRMADTIYFYDYDRKVALKQIMRLAEALSEAGMSEKKKASFFVSPINRYHTMRDSARMYELFKDYISKEELRSFKSMVDLHDYLADLDFKRRNRAMWDRYHEEVLYSDNILKLEGRHDNADFRIIKSPWELKDLGNRFHNCVSSYMEDVKQKKSIIVEMLLNGKSEACIELDGSGKTCLQAFASCNRRLEGDAVELFDKWTKMHGIALGRLVPRAAHTIMDVRAWDVPDTIPF